jgi:hypothetical protein
MKLAFLFQYNLSKRPIKIRPVKAEKSKDVINICGKSETLGAGTHTTIEAHENAQRHQLSCHGRR